KETLVKIHAELLANFSCKRPTTPVGEELFDGYKNSDAFMRYLARFIDDGKKALAEPNPKKACAHWQNSLGGRFPCDLAEGLPTQHAAPGLAAGVGAASPWLNAE